MEPEIGEERFCPACHKTYADWSTLKKHLQKAQTEGDLNHIEIIELEGWDEILKAPVEKGVLIIDDEYLS